MSASEKTNAHGIEGHVSRPAMTILTVDEGAAFLKISRSTLRRMALERQIPCAVIRAGGRKKVFRFRLEELERWLIAQERQFARQKP